MLRRQHQSSGCRWSSWRRSCCVLIVILHLQYLHPQSKTAAWSPPLVVTRRTRRCAVADNRRTIRFATLLWGSSSRYHADFSLSRDEQRDDDDGEVENENENDNETFAATPQHFLLDSASWGFYYDERRPVRHHPTKRAANFDAAQAKSDTYHGGSGRDTVPEVVRDPSPPDFPSTIESLTDQISSVLCSENHRDTRIGLQIEGLQYLQSSSSKNVSGRHGSSREYAAMRHMALLLAGKLSSSAFDASSSPLSLRRNNEHDSSLSSKKFMPISIYLNTVKHCLSASQELLFLKRVEKHQQKKNNRLSSVYDRIQIRCLRGDHPMIPPDMLLRDQSKRRQRRLTHAKIQMRRQRGLILVVQPTDYNDEYEPPGPAINVWTALQELVASAAVEGLPVVCISPRYLPGNPAPWVLRDFAAPVLSWTVRMDEHVAVWHSAAGSTASKEPSSSLTLSSSTGKTTSAESSRWHVFAVNNNDDRSQSFPYLASCRDPPSNQKLRHLVNEYMVS